MLESNQLRINIIQNLKQIYDFLSFLYLDTLHNTIAFRVLFCLTFTHRTLTKLYLLCFLSIASNQFCVTVNSRANKILILKNNIFSIIKYFFTIKDKK